jgi:hypothetical protein
LGDSLLSKVLTSLGCDVFIVLVVFMRAWASDAVVNVRASFSLLSFSYPIPPRLFFLSIIFIFLFYYYSLFQAFLLTIYFFVFIFSFLIFLFLFLLFLYLLPFTFFLALELLLPFQATFKLCACWVGSHTSSPSFLIGLWTVGCSLLQPMTRNKLTIP